MLRHAPGLQPPWSAFFILRPLASLITVLRCVSTGQISPTAKPTQMGFLKNKDAVSGGSGGGGYLNPSKIQSGGSVRFALLSDEPLEFFECWGEATDGSVRPFRFADDPSPTDIEEELGPDYSRRMNREGTGPEPVKFAIAVPVYNFETGAVQVMSLTQKGLIKELDQVSQTEDYSDLMAWDFGLIRRQRRVGGAAGPQIRWPSPDERPV